MYIRLVDNQVQNIPSFWPHRWPFEQIVKNLPDKGKLLEIGPYLGKSTASWALSFRVKNKDWNIHTIDAFKGINKAWPGMEYLQITEEEHLPQFEKNIAGWDNITWEKTFWTPDYKGDRDYDVLFYDGLHDYQSVKQVLEHYINVSCIVVDDYDKEHEGTMEAVDEFYNSLPWPKEFEHIIEEGKGIAVIWQNLHWSLNER
tara:strand:+ start:1343 stop:1945 length:603 start_codon:yes stop_codon:yes gene_type:complete